MNKKKFIKEMKKSVISADIPETERNRLLNDFSCLKYMSDGKIKNKKMFIQLIERDILEAEICDFERNKLLKNFLYLKRTETNILITGATGSGKSSTINALFGEQTAKVGVSAEPETTEIVRYDFGNLILWDSPGLGDGKEADQCYSKNIIAKLNEKDGLGRFLIDLVLIIIDGSSRDLGTSYELINEVIIPNLGEEKNSIFIAVNQADMAMKGHCWNLKENKPEPELAEFLNNKAVSVRKRMKESTGIDIDPVCYSAGYQEEGGKQCSPYHITELFYNIINAVPQRKRIANFDQMIGSSFKTAGCYITTAVCEEYGKPDNCYELTEFRKFRDGWLAEQPDGEELIAYYYATAPDMVELINRQENRKDIYRYLYETYLLQCLEYIEKEKYEECKKLYTDMMLYLFYEKGTWQ